MANEDEASWGLLMEELCLVGQFRFFSLKLWRMMRKHVSRKRGNTHGWLFCCAFQWEKFRFLFLFRKEKTKRTTSILATNNNGDSVRIQTSENQKKTLNFLFLSFCVHIHKERERWVTIGWESWVFELWVQLIPLYLCFFMIKLTL